MKIIRNLIILFLFISNSSLSANNDLFKQWLIDFRIHALENNISESTFDMAMSDVIFLPKVIKYDRFQPEFYEDTNTYISKRSSSQKVKKGANLYKSNQSFINSIDNKFSVEKSLLLALMGIETNFGTYVGKMDILSSLATLSFDKRRSEFFTNELITILQLVEAGIIDYKILYGSWAGAFGNFQFMPSTINKYAIDYDKNSIIELKSIEDSFASAANYLKTIGWKKGQPCFIKVDLKDNIPKKYLNSSARDIKNKKKISFFKKYIKDFENLNINNDLLSAIIIPDKDIIPGAETLSPAYIVFNNYEKILNWNRSLRFALAVCTLKDNFKNEI